MSRDASPYEVLIDERVEKDLEKVPKFVVEKFLKLLDEFERNPIRPRPGFDVKPMEGYPSNTYRLRIGKIRIHRYLDDLDTHLRTCLAYYSLSDHCHITNQHLAPVFGGKTR